MPDTPSSVRPVDPRKVFLVAEQFRRSAGVILGVLVPAPAAIVSADGDVPYQMSPVIAVSAFAFELFLKCLLLLDGDELPRTHDLNRLFNALKEDRRRQIEMRYEEQRQESRTAAGPNFPLARVLEQSADAFESHRYIYELDDPRTVSPFTVQVLCNTVRKILLELHPEWDR